MKLKEFMKLADDGICYHIGSKAGFLLVVTPEEYPEHIKKADEVFLDATYKKIAEIYESSTYEIKLKRMFADENIIQGYVLTAEYEAHMKEKARYVKRFYRLLEKLKEFVPYEEREVIEAYDRTEENTAVVRIEGNEDGKFWTRPEYEAWAKTVFKEEENEPGNSDDKRVAEINESLEELRV